jgi:hypothetical protein
VLNRARGHDEAGPGTGQPSGGVRTDGPPPKPNDARASGGR